MQTVKQIYAVFVFLPASQANYRLSISIARWFDVFFFFIYKYIRLSVCELAYAYIVCTPFTLTKHNDMMCDYYNPNSTVFWISIIFNANFFAYLFRFYDAWSNIFYIYAILFIFFSSFVRYLQNWIHTWMCLIGIQHNRTRSYFIFTLPLI